MPTATCHDAYNAGRHARAMSPLRQGQYKLDEARNEIDRWCDMIETITKRLRAGAKFGGDECLGPCMAHERGSYLKSIPARLAHLMGSEILPGIAALEGDGWPKADVECLKRRAEVDARRLLADCEAARLRLRGGIQQEYEAMRRSKSELLMLLHDTRSLAELGLSGPVLDAPVIPVVPRRDRN